MCDAELRKTKGVLNLIATVLENKDHAKVAKRRAGRFSFATKPTGGFIEVVASDAHGVAVSRTVWTTAEFGDFLQAAEEIYHASLQPAE